MIYLRNTVKGSGADTRRLKSVARALLRSVDEPQATLSISLVDDREIRALNREHRGKDRPTDVLSFPLQAPDRERATRVMAPDAPERLLGDVVISVDAARRQAAGYDAPLQNELYRLLIHGLLHVLGHDHEQPAERAAMESEERRLAAAIGMPWPYE